MNNILLKYRLKNIFKKTAVTLLLLFLLPLTAFAEVDYSLGGDQALSSQPSVFDPVDAIKPEDEEKLKSVAEEIKTKYGETVVFATVSTFHGKDSQYYAEEFFLKNNYGLNGVAFVTAVGDRKWAISTNGKSIDYFTDRGIEWIFNEINPYFGEDDFSGGYSRLGDIALEFYSQGSDGSPYEGSEELEIGDIGAILAIGILPTLFIIFVLVNQMKSVKHQGNANMYIKRECSNSRVVSEVFTNTTLIRNKRQDKSDTSTHTNSAGGRSGGGSSSF